jgi:hypothetical protein
VWNFVRIEVLTALTVKVAVFWNMALHNLADIHPCLRNTQFWTPSEFRSSPKVGVKTLHLRESQGA